MADEMKGERGRWWILLFQVPWLSVVLLALLAAIVFGPMTRWEAWVVAQTLPDDYPQKVVATPDGTRAVLLLGNKLCLCDLTTGTTLASYAGEGNASEVVVSPDGSRIAVLPCFVPGPGPRVQGTAFLIDAKTGDRLFDFDVDGDLAVVAFSPDGLKVFTSHEGAQHRLWDAVAGNAILDLEETSNSVARASFSPDGKRLLTGGPGIPALWDTATGKSLGMFMIRGGARLAAFSGSGKRVLINQRYPKANRCRILDAESLSAVATIEVAYGCQLSPDGRLLGIFEGTRDQVTIRDAETGKRLSVLSMPGLLNLRFTRGSERMITWSPAGDLWVWDAHTGNRLFTVSSCGFSVEESPDGSRLFLLDEGEYAVQVRDAENGAILSEFSNARSFWLLGDDVALVSKAYIGSEHPGVPAEELADVEWHPNGLLRRRRPEWWWGVFWLPEFWLAALLGAAFAWSAVRDGRRFMRRRTRP